MQSDFKGLLPAPASVLFRTVNWLLFKVVKHSGARSAHVDAAMNGNYIVIIVSDSGKGFDAFDFKAKQAAGEAFGLFSIKERISFLGGSFSIESSPGARCRATIAVQNGEPVFSYSVSHINVPIEIAVFVLLAFSVGLLNIFISEYISEKRYNQSFRLPLPGLF